MKNRISGEFKSRLAKLKPESMVDVVIFGRDSIDPIINYFKENDIFVAGRYDNLGAVYGHLTRDQVYDLAKKQYVKIMLENQGIRVYKPGGRHD